MTLLLATPPKSRFIILIAFLLQILPLSLAFPEYNFLENGSPLLRGRDTGFLLDTPTRLKIDLSGVWNYSVTDGPEGSVRVPSVYDFIGEVTFQRMFEINPDDLLKYQFHLVVLGSNYNTGVTINNDFITNHLGGYTTFVTPIPTNVLQGGNQNVIKVSTDNKLDAAKTVPLRSQVWGWKNYGGIARDIYILATPKIYISTVAVIPTLNEDLSGAKIKVNATIDGSVSKDSVNAHPLQVYAELFDKQTNALVATSNMVSVSYQNKQWSSASVEMMVAHPRLWSPETPDLYYVKTHLVNGSAASPVDEYDMNTGIRKIDFVDGKILLNGKKILLQGLIWMEDHPLFGSSLPYEAMEKDIAMIKGTGANAIRIGHHPCHPYILTLCDRYGLLALEELPVNTVPGAILSQEYYLDLASTMMREMITRDRHHPSILAWGLGDDFETRAGAGCAYVEQLSKLSRSLDSRPVYYATRLQTDACSDLIDMKAITLSTRDVKEFKKSLENLRAANPSKPLLIIKMGAEVQPGNNNGYSDPLSIQAQARYYLQHVDAIRSANVDGVFLWSFNDWKGDRPALTVNSGDPWMHTLGIVSYGRDKRLAYEAVRAAFGGEKFSALQIGSTQSSAPIIYVLVGLILLIGTAYIYNVNRRFREALNRSMVNSYNFFADVRDQRIVTFFQSTLLGCIVSAASAIVISSYLYRFRGSIMLDNLLSYLLVSDRIKEIVVTLILNPKLFLPVVTGLIFFKLFIIAFVLWLIAPALKARIYPYHAYAITIWSTTPLMILVPLGMILYRLLDSPMYIVPSLVVLLLLVVWVLVRFLKGVAIVFDKPPVRVYAVGFFVVAAFFAGAYFYLDYTQSASMYVTFMYNDFIGGVQ